jgi:hypothetical protein
MCVVTDPWMWDGLWNSFIAMRFPFLKVVYNHVLRLFFDFSIRNTAVNSSNVFGLLNRALSYVEQ